MKFWTGASEWVEDAGKSEPVLLSTTAVLFSLMFVWPMPHTITLRQLLLTLGLLALVPLAIHRGRRAADIHPPVVSLSILALLTLWIIAVILFVTDERAWALGEFFDEWLWPLLALLLGIAAVRVWGLEKSGYRRLILILVAPLVLHMLWLDVCALWHHFSQGMLPDRAPGLTSGPDKSNYLSNMALCFLIAEGGQRLLGRHRTLPIGSGILLVLLGAGFFSHYLERVRNGSVALLIVLIVASGIWLWERRRWLNYRLVSIVVACTLLVCASVGYMLVRDPRWQTFMETMPIAWNTQQHRAWLDWNKYPHPVLSNGQEVDHSNYMRIVWFKTAMQLAWENPLGVGFGRNAYGHAFEKKFGAHEGHSHYGFLDLAIGIGIPGLLLWLTFLASLLVSATSRYQANRSFAALTLVLVVTDYGTRMFLDSIVRDHMLEQFFFVVAVLSSLMAWEYRRSNQQ